VAIARAQIARELPEPNGALVEMYKQVMRDLDARAKMRLVRDGRRLTAEAHRARLLMAEVADILEDLGVDVDTWIAQEITTAYKRGVGIAELGFSEIGLSAPNVVRPLVHKEAIQLLVDELQDDLDGIDQQIFKGYRRATRRTQLAAAQDKLVTEKVARGIAEGKARREVSRELTRQLLEDLKDKPLVINGRKYNVKSYAEMVARTKTREAQTAGTVNRVLEAGEDLVMISAHGAKDGCSYYEGKVFSITGDSEKYPALSSVPNGGPPFHPNCKHGLAPYVEKFASGAEKRRAVGVPDSALGKSYADVEKLYQRSVN
jgi:hypothetical protein